MGLSEERLGAAVDEVLEPAWPAARRRAALRLAAGAAGRWAGGMALLALLVVAARAVLGLEVPWIFFAVVGPVAGLAVLPDPDDWRHLRRETEGAGTGAAGDDPVGGHAPGGAPDQAPDRARPVAPARRWRGAGPPPPPQPPRQQ